MTSTSPAYHRQVASEKRAAILAAAMALFGELGYHGTSLARVADAANVSKATLFKQFPTKDDLFAAIVTDYWDAGQGTERIPSPGDPRAGLTLFGTRYAELLVQEQMVGLHRMVIAEAPRFPELARMQFDLGKAPFFDQVRSYLEAETEATGLAVADATTAATQFLGMISNVVLWPRLLLVDFKVTSADISRVVDEAVETMLARYQRGPTGNPAQPDR